MKKFLALFLVVLTIVSVFAGCGGGSDEIVLPKQDIEETTENRQKAILATAWAYYNKNPYVQYDQESLTVGGRGLGVRNAADMSNTPEMAGPQRNIFHVCSYYVYGTTFHTFDYQINGGWDNAWIKNMATPTDEDLQQYVVWQHVNDPDYDKNHEAMEEFKSMLQVGDIITYTRYHRDDGSGHTVIWADDCDGDGDTDILNVDGSYYDDTEMVDIREDNGAVDINYNSGKALSGEWFFFNEAAYDYFPKLKAISIIRFADEKHAEKLPITERAKTRMLYPGLKIFFEAENGIYGSVPQGGEYTYTLRLENISEQDHKGLLIQLPVPQNAEIVKVNGAGAKNKTQKFKVDLPAGSTAAITYTVKATGSVGDIITTGVGYVHAIPLPSLNTVIVSAETDAAKVTAAMEENKGKNGEEFLAAYLKSMGMEGAIPSLSDIQSALYRRTTYGDYKMFMAKTADKIDAKDMNLYKMQIPEFFGGTFVATDIESLRVKELRNEDLLVGDILLWQPDNVSEPMVAVHNGTALICAVNGQLVPMSQYDLDHFIKYRFFIALRPTQVL